ncbi:C2H2 finger domain transcription factor CON7 [Erysiphe necator]|uniref:Putative transcriptional regulator n=1 Tax=Uncinula necator TaxID=52586 RepID=A0A0B1NYH4_UNCNE|nr:C2H2 finger domain transcription factor CON7 [Erysiphe necator]KHJ30085.1 putative transcriptional regulator [Erysiphe necator]
MSLASKHSITNTLIASLENKDRNSSPDNTEASLLGALASSSQDVMERTMSSAYASQPGSHSSYPSAPVQSEAQSQENLSAQPSTQSSTAQPYTQSPGVKSNTGSPPEYGVFPTSASSTNFPDQISRQSHPASNHSGSSGGMPPATNPSIAASSPTYQTHAGQYSPYPPQQDIPQTYNSHPHNPMYSHPRPDWAGYANHPQHPMQSGYTIAGAHSTPPSAPAGVRPGQVYSFVPIPGAQQHKRPRRRYEEIERMYKCGFNGCEKAYGTLNHLNAHVTMQAHGSKRTPEEFKEIRKEWKARKKEEENQRKVGDERKPDGTPPTGFPPNARSVQLPPISYQTGAQIPSPYQNTPQEFATSQQPLTYSGYPTAPYGNGTPAN